MSGPQIFSKQENVAIQNENVLFFMKFPKVVVKPKWEIINIGINKWHPHKRMHIQFK